jgi:hypothetical protein
MFSCDVVYQTLDKQWTIIQQRAPIVPVSYSVTSTISFTDNHLLLLLLGQTEAILGM